MDQSFTEKLIGEVEPIVDTGAAIVHAIGSLVDKVQATLHDPSQAGALLEEVKADVDRIAAAVTANTQPPANGG